MHAAEREQMYPERLSFRMSTEVAAAVQLAAAESGKKAGEWVRALVEREVKGDASTRVLLAELLKFETLFLTLQMEHVRSGELTDEALTALVDRADKLKFAKADRAIVEGRQG